MSLLELIIAGSILLILSSAALPTLRIIVVRQREQELRLDLREMRNAIDHYKELADRNMIRVELGSEGYPPDLETLVKGVSVGGGGATGHNVRFLRRIPVDPMTGRKEWECARSKMIQIPRARVATMYSTFILNRQRPPCMARDTRTGKLRLYRFDF